MERMRQPCTIEKEMLRYKSSQIHLAPADVGDLDRRRAFNKERACPDASTARLSAGPRLPTIIAAAHPEDSIRHPLGCTWDSHPRHRRRQTSPDVYRLPIRAGREVFRELPGGSKARHQGETQIHGDPRRGPRDTRTHASAVSILTDLDPGAPVFTPRVRFGSTTVVAHAERIDTSNLRLQAPSEQNTSPDPERPHQASFPIQEARPRRLRSNAVVSPPRRSSDNALALPNVDRYPVLLPSNRSPRSPRPEVTVPQASPANTSENESTPPPASSSRIPSIVSAASGISSLSIAEDAAAEFLKFRSSPLDGLTAELSRLSTALGPASTTSERRVGLLNGNPFDCVIPSQEESADSFSLPKAAADTSDLLPPMIEAPPSQPLESESPAHSTASPKVPVYNDATPARLQPQTPADIQRSQRRVHKKSDSSAHREAFCIGQILVAQRPAIPERRYRNTYPASENANEVEGHLESMETELAVHVRRRQGGSLDVTPPGQGRFERFLD